MNRKLSFITVGLTLLIFLTTPSLDRGQWQACGQEEEMKIVDDINELQEKLAAPNIAAQDEAEAELIKMGSVVLDHLESPNENFTTAKNERLVRIRNKLEEQALRENTTASSVTITGKTTMAEALKMIRRQTGNKIAIREGLDDIYGATELELELDKAPFWIAVDKVLHAGEFSIDPYGGEPGTLTVIPNQEHPAHGGNLDGVKNKIFDVPRDAAGLFDVSVSNVSCYSNFENPATSYTNMNLRIRWEPRIRPISIDLPCEKMKLIDEFDGPISVSNAEAVLSGMVQPEVSELEFSVPLQLIERDIAEIKSFECQIDAVLPGRTETFRFDKLGEIEESESISKSGVIVTYEGFTQNEDLYGVNVTFGFEEGAGEVDSHLSWIYDNEVYLENSAGEIFPDFGQNTRRQDESGLTIQYLFDFDPSDYTLVYKSPAAIARIPVTVVVKKIPLP